MQLEKGQFEPTTEMLIAYLIEDLGIEFEEGEAITPIEKDGQIHLIMSRVEHHFFPFHIIVSTEICAGTPIDLHRGKRRLSQETSWVYFGDRIDQVSALPRHG